jgi:hypothetical protein
MESKPGISELSSFFFKLLTITKTNIYMCVCVCGHTLTVASWPLHDGSMNSTVCIYTDMIIQAHDERDESRKDTRWGKAN